LLLGEREKLGGDLSEGERWVRDVSERCGERCVREVGERGGLV
jgi:hypothetical protein